MRQWTTEQRQCIEARGGSLLVSAAAGSGKTSVLVERILRRITDPDNPADVDRLLVVTFTKAAAAEMKQRLAAALSALLAEHPEDRRLARQQMLLPRAHISTVHGFCADLLREHFHALDLSPQFRVAEEGQTALLREEAVTEVLEEGYAGGDPAFLELAGLLSTGRSDRGFQRAIERIYGFIQSHPFPDLWLNEQEARYSPEGPDASDTPWGLLVRARILDTVRYAVTLLDKAIALAEEEERMAAAYGPALRAGREALRELCRTLPRLGWDETGAALDAFAFPPFGRLLKYGDEPRKARVTALRDEVKKRMKPLSALLCGSGADFREDRAALYPLIRILFGVVRQFGERYQEKKAGRQIVDFNDLEHGALRLLIAQGENGLGVRTPLAVELSSRFDEVLVDEYQDTNAAQDALFTALSREETNLFFVGDVKQSIYGFRQAMPDLFIARRDAYPPFDGTAFPASITLGHNFRSRREVTDAVNFVFRQLMTRETGGIRYDGREALVPSASYPQADGCETELWVLDAGTLAPDDSRDAAEARLIAGRIHELLDAFPVTENGRTRPARFGDFCILLRSKAAHAAAYADELNRCGIPAWTAAAGGFFAAPEVASAISLLRFIDNPLQDVPLLAVLLSPAFGFTPDDLARIRMRDKASPLFAAVRRMGEAEEEEGELARRCADFLARVDGWRLLAASLPADRLIRRLFDDSGLIAAAAASRHGEQRAANLRLLLDYARGFEQNGFRGLSAFVRYLDRLEQQDMDLSPASAAEAGNAVRILSIHNSKGLEFPVVFLAGLGGLFNPDSTRGDLLLHAQAGVGLVRRDPASLRQVNTLPRQGVALAIQNSERAEELRVLYVAMTRAKEKLCMTMTLRQPEALLARLAATLGGEEALPAYTVLTARSMSEWLLACALRHPSGKILRDLAGDGGVSLRPAETPWRVEVARAPARRAEAAEAREAPPPDPARIAVLRERLAYTYPYAALGRAPSKLAASALSRGEEGLRPRRPFVARTRPAFLSRSGLSPAERGTALHTFMQFADYPRAAADPQAEIQRLVQSRFLTPEQAASLPLPKIRRFFAGGLYARMAASPFCRREEPFTIGLPASRFADAPGAADELVIVQGIADCVFEEEGGLVLVDYKTDRASNGEELAARYADQLRIYAFALAQTLERPVKSCLLYAFSLDAAVPVAFEETGEFRLAALEETEPNRYVEPAGDPGEEEPPEPLAKE